MSMCRSYGVPKSTSRMVENECGCSKSMMAASTPTPVHRIPDDQTAGIVTAHRIPDDQTAGIVTVLRIPDGSDGRDSHCTQDT